MGKFFHRYEPAVKNLIPCLSVSSTGGNIASTDIGKLVVASSNNHGLALGTTADNQVFLGYIAAVPTTIAVSSSDPFYVQPVLPYEVLEADYSTAISTSTTLPATSDIGKYIGFSNTTTIAGAVLDLDTIGNAKGTTSGCFLRITGFDNVRRKLYGCINSSHLIM
jgi:hypothetical protein